MFVLDGVKRKYLHITWNSIKPVLRCYRTNLLSWHTFHLPVLWHVLIMAVAPYLTLHANLQALISTSRGLEAWGGPNSRQPMRTTSWSPVATYDYHCPCLVIRWSAGSKWLLSNCHILPMFCYPDGLKHMILVTTLQIWPIPGEFAWSLSP